MMIMGNFKKMYVGAIDEQIHLVSGQFCCPIFIPEVWYVFERFHGVKEVAVFFISHKAGFQQIVKLTEFIPWQPKTSVKFTTKCGSGNSISRFLWVESGLFKRRVARSMTQSYAEKDYSAQLCGYLCVPLRLKKAALQVEPNPQKGASGNTP